MTLVIPGIGPVAASGVIPGAGSVALAETGGATDYSLSASVITSGVPSLAAPTISQDHTLTAQPIVAGIPILGTPTIADSNHELTATEITAAFPLLGTPTLTEIVSILGADIPTTGDHGGSPVPNDFTINPAARYSWEVVTPPSAGVLTIFVDLTYTWDATGVADGDYSWVYRLYENAVSVGTATVYMHAGALAVTPIVAGAPLLGTPTVTQNHTISAAGISASAPALGSPTLTEVAPGYMVPLAIETVAPVLGTPSLTQTHSLVAGAIACGAPVFSTPSLTQQHAMMADGITASAPTLGTPTLTEVPPSGEVWPAESDVRLGVTYGPTGIEYTGTMTGGTGASAADIAAALIENPDFLTVKKFIALGNS